MPMKKKLLNKEQKLWMLIGALWVLGFFFRFALAGYSILAYALFISGGIIAAYKGLRYLKPKKPKLSRTLNKVLTYGLLLSLMALAITEGAIISDAHSDEELTGDYVIILGAGVNGEAPSYTLKTRLRAGLEVLEENPGAMCIVSGGQGPGEDITEAECMCQWLVENGVAPERILKEEKSTNTKENIQNSLRVLKEYGGTPEDGIVVVTSEFHTLRAKLIAAKHGVDVQSKAAVTGLPFLTVNYFLREALSLWKYLIFG